MKAPSLTVLIPHKGGSYSHDEPDGDEEDSQGDDGGDAEDITNQLAELLGISEDKRAEFADLMHAFKEC